jgi:hypothetical protein
MNVHNDVLKISASIVQGAEAHVLTGTPERPDMIETFPTDRADEALRIAILPVRTR